MLSGGLDDAIALDLAGRLEKFVKQEEALGVELGCDLSWSVPLHSFLYNGAYAKTYYQRPNIRMPRATSVRFVRHLTRRARRYHDVREHVSSG
jgi:hypothetical protein